MRKRNRIQEPGGRTTSVIESPPSSVEPDDVRTPEVGREEIDVRTPEVSHEEIEVLAYHLWETQGRPEGTALENWHEAERQLRGRA